ncbi:PREDICTED: immunoglobulin omega chain-like [Odobenus rosmarus divergens]
MVGMNKMLFDEEKEEEDLVANLVPSYILLVRSDHLLEGSLSQPMLTQPLPTPASPGTTARLTCTLSRDIGVGGSNIYWIQQQPGSPPRDLLYYSSDSDKHQGSGVPGRFSGSKDASANEGLLRILGLQAEAEADSHWATAHCSGSSCRSSQRLREGGSGSKSSGPTALVSEFLLLRSFCGGFCRGVSSVRRPVLEEEGQTHRLCCGLSQHRCPSRTPG